MGKGNVKTIRGGANAAKLDLAEMVSSMSEDEIQQLLTALAPPASDIPGATNEPAPAAARDIAILEAELADRRRGAGSPKPLVPKGTKNALR